MRNQLNHDVRCAIRWIAIASCAALLCCTGCGSQGPQRAPIKGKVTVAGAPLAKGQILFVPQHPLEGPATAAAIVNGEYALPKEQGPLVGMNRIEVTADPNLGFPIDDEQAFVARKGAPLPRSPIPPTYNQYSTLTYEVKPNEENTYELDVTPAR